MTPSERYINFVWDRLTSKLSDYSLYYSNEFKQFFLIDTTTMEGIFHFQTDTLFWEIPWGEEFKDKYGLDMDEFSSLLVDYINNLLVENKEKIETLNSKLNSRFLKEIVTNGFRPIRVLRVGLSNIGFTRDITKTGFKIKIKHF
jgi:hypothetical protein